ncbi:MAG: hypothetical protein ACPGVW_11470 [Pseudoalteromonas marina]
MRKYVFSLLFILLLAGCDFEVPGADERFGTQNFVSAISLIELHKTRNGVYPNTLAELDFLGDWDGIWLSAVKYVKKMMTATIYTLREDGQVSPH